MHKFLVEIDSYSNYHIIFTCSAFGFASLSSEDGVLIADGYQLNTDRPSMLIFKESISQAAVTLDVSST